MFQKTSWWYFDVVKYAVLIFVFRVMRDPSGFIPTPVDRYRQILLPALRLLQVILTSTSINHHQGAAQVNKCLPLLLF